MGNFVTFRLITDKKEGTESFKGGRALKDTPNGKVLKHINYWPGGSSIYDEDNKDSAIKAKSVVFKYNDILTDPAVEIIVRKSDKQLLDYLMAHPANGRRYKIYDEDQVALEKSASYDSIAEAMDAVRKGKDIELQAMAVCVLGAEYHGKSVNICKAALNEKAVKNPSAVLAITKSDTFLSRYIASTAIITGTIKSNAMNTAVVWGDGKEGVILNLAKGENGIDKLTELLSEPGDQGSLLRQEIESRLHGGVAQGIEDPRDKEIAELKRQLALQQTDKKEKKEVEKPKVDTSEFDGFEIEKLRELYKTKTGKNLSIAYQNNRDWIIGKLTE